jgi:iron-sulfur cluster assembly protein
MITLTDSAVKELKRLMADAPEAPNKLLRVSVSGGGCSGLQYNMGFIEEGEYSPNKDAMYSQEDIGIVVDKKSELFINGTTIDWYEDLMKRGFTFDNPNSSGGCGCGESFSV